MITLSRTDTSQIGRWWWTVDRWLLFAVGALVTLGLLLTLAASPAVAERLDYEPFHFVRRQMLFVIPAVLLMFWISLQPPRMIRRLALLGFLSGMLLLLATLLIGPEVNGARRWLFLAGFSIQPSEFVKPCFAVLAGWLFAVQRQQPEIPANLVCCALFALVMGMLLMQPDIGMAFVLASVWAAQFFMAGLPLVLVAGLALLAIGGAVAAYLFVPHVTSRVDRFRDPSSGDSYQVDRALDAIANGGLFGRGPGEGVAKRVLPDAHTDFIFAVAGEEFGLLVGLLILALFAFVMLRGVLLLLRQESMFVLLAAGGLLVQFTLQAVINIGVNVNLLPTKGMTLPFISYGGSSLFALAIGMGMLLALTRRRPHEGGAP